MGGWGGVGGGEARQVKLYSRLVFLQKGQKCNLIPRLWLWLVCFITFPNEWNWLIAKKKTCLHHMMTVLHDAMDYDAQCKLSWLSNVTRFTLFASKALTTTVETEFRPLTHVTLPHRNSNHNEARLTTVVNTLPALIRRLRSLPRLISECRNIWGLVAPVGCLKSKIEWYY